MKRVLLANYCILNYTESVYLIFYLARGFGDENRHQKYRRDRVWRPEQTHAHRRHHLDRGWPNHRRRHGTRSQDRGTRRSDRRPTDDGAARFDRSAHSSGCRRLEPTSDGIRAARRHFARWRDDCDQPRLAVFARPPADCKGHQSAIDAACLHLPELPSRWRFEGAWRIGDPRERTYQGRFCRNARGRYPRRRRDRRLRYYRSKRRRSHVELGTRARLGGPSSFWAEVSARFVVSTHGRERALLSARCSSSRQRRLYRCAMGRNRKNNHEVQGLSGNDFRRQSSNLAPTGSHAEGTWRAQSSID